MNLKQSILHDQPIRRISIVNFTGIRANWGCQATSWELLKFLNSAFPAGDLPEVDLVPLLPRYEIDRDLEQNQIDEIYEAMLSICADGKGNGNALAYLERICMERYGAFAESVRRSDIVFFQAEGTMAGTDFLRGARLLLLPLVAKHAWSKPVFVLNQTIFVCAAKFGEVLSAAYNTFDFVAVRENISFSAAKEFGIQPVFHIPDTAFLTSPAHSTRLPDFSDGSYFAVTGSAYFSSEIHEQIFLAADRIKRETGLKPLLAGSTGADMELQRLAERYWGTSQFVVVPPDVDYCAAAFALKHCRFLIGGRFHMTIMAASVHVPSIQLRGNSYKNEGLSAMLDGSAPVRDAADHEVILSDAFALLEPEACERLRDRMEPIRRSLRDAGQWFAACLNGRCAEIPASFLAPPGRAIKASDYIEPYRTNSFEHARAFTYPPANGDALGPRPAGGNTLPYLLSSWQGGDIRALGAIRQILTSYPKIAETLKPALRAELQSLPLGDIILPQP